MGARHHIILVGIRPFLKVWICKLSGYLCIRGYVVHLSFVILLVSERNVGNSIRSY